MDRSDVSEADLLRAFAALQDSELDAAAEVIGFTRISTPKSKGPAPREQSKQAPGLVTTRSQPKERTAPEGPQEAPYFWRITSDLPIGTRSTTGPAWLGTQQPIDDESIEASSFATATAQPLASAQRFATFIRRHLAVAMRSTEPDTHVAVQRIARGEALAGCPALTRHRWPGGVHLIIDASSHLWPLAFDMGVLTSELERLLGQRLRIFRSLGTPAAIQDADMRLASVPADGAPVIVLGDAALLGPDTSRQRAWLAWGRQQQLAGRRALLLAPVQASAITRELAEAFDVVPLGQGSGLRLMAGGKRAQVDSSPAEAQALEPPAALLRDLLYGNSYVVPALLRALRRLLQAHGHELGVAAEVNVWRHSSVIRDPGGCALHPGHRDEVRLRLLELKRELLLAALALHWDALHDASPLVRSEFAQWWAALLQDRGETGPWRAVLAQGIDEAEQLMRRIAAALWTQPGERCTGLAAYLRRFGSRSPSLLSASEGHQLAWTLAQRDGIASGAVQMPGTIDLSAVGWLLGNDAANKSMSLVIHGDSQPANPGRVRLGWSDDLPPSMSRLADGVTVGKLWSAEFLPAARERTLRWMRALSLLLSDRRQSAGLPAVYATIQDWERSVALNEGGIGTPTDASGRAVRKEEPRRLGPVHEWVLEGMTTERMKHLRAAQDEVEKRVLEGRRDDLSMERLAHELWAWLKAFRKDDATHKSSVDDLPKLLYQVLAGGDLETVHQLAELPRAARQHMQQRSTADLSPGHACTLRLPNRTLVLDAIPRPVWAESIWRDEGGLMAEVAGGRRLRWCPASARQLIDSVEGTEYHLPRGCWWDDDEQRNFFSPSERALTRPSWATRHGVDDHGYWAEFEVQRIVQRMRFIPPGRFWMGSPLAEGRSTDETLHPVTLTRGFWLADTTCTQELWQAVTGTLPEDQRGTDSNLPVVAISHDDITQRFLPTLERHLPGFGGRLPSEAEWEYAARAGTQTAFPWGNVADPERMNYGAAEKQGAVHVLPARSFTPNPWGLRQMHGNVFEWCSDGLVDYPTDEALDPIAEQSAERVRRGGPWIGNERYWRSAQRNADDTSKRSGLTGFRLARGLPEAGRAEPGGRGAPVLPAEPAAFSERPERPSLADKLKQSAAPKRGSRQPLPSDKKRKK